MMYCEFPGREHIDQTLKLAKERALQLGTKNVIVASTRGFTAQKACEALTDTKTVLIIVGIDRDRFPQDLLERLEEAGHNVCFGREVTYEYS